MRRSRSHRRASSPIWSRATAPPSSVKLSTASASAGPRSACWWPPATIPERIAIRRQPGRDLVRGGAHPGRSSGKADPSPAIEPRGGDRQANQSALAHRAGPPRSARSPAPSGLRGAAHSPKAAPNPRSCESLKRYVARETTRPTVVQRVDIVVTGLAPDCPDTPCCPSIDLPSRHHDTTAGRSAS